VISFEFATATRIIFGSGSVKQIPALAKSFGSRALVVTGHTPARAETLLGTLAAEGVATTVVAVAGEPTVDDALRGATQARASNCDCVIGIGGGSALDAAKAISGLMTNDGDIFDYLEVIGRGRSLSQPAAPCIAIPTTAGTGSEVTRNAVLSSPAHRVKVSLRSPFLLPRLAVIDPELTFALPASVTASTGLDALTQLIEPYVSSRANPLTDSFCREGIQRAARSLQRAVENGQDAAAREDMSLASLLGGLALANAGLGAVHGLAAPIGGAFDAPHGAVCAALLPHVIEFNLAALRSRAPAHASLARYDEIARIVTQDSQATAPDLLAWTKTLVATLKIPRLSTYGLTPADFPSLVQAATAASSMKANPISLTQDELTSVLAHSL
jgi:alcohol dehydrogenase class IV